MKNIFLLLILLFPLNVRCQQITADEMKKSDKAVFVLDEWMRDPYVTLGPDNYYYLSCTRLKHTANKPGIEMWRSKDLVHWDPMGLLWSFKDSKWMPEVLAKASKEKNKEIQLWAPEVHFVNGRWVTVFMTPLAYSNLLMTDGPEMKGPFEEPAGSLGNRHDPSVFVEDDGSAWVVWGWYNTKIQKLKKDMSGFYGPEISIAPSNRGLGHEGWFILKIHGKYVLFGTAWSTDTLRHGSYNLYYCTSDHLQGPYGLRKFAGRFLGHGTIFQDKSSNWWCTAFLNGDYVTPEQVLQNGVSTNRAETVNKQGLTLVPMDIHIENGDVVVRAKDPVYANPGKDEVQDFSKKE